MEAVVVVELVQRAQQRDVAAFERLIGLYERTALAVAYGVVGDASESGDVVQEAFVRAWQRLADLKDPQKFAAWLCGIVRNLAVDSRRRGRGARRCDSVEQAARNVVPDPAEELARREAHDQLAWAIAELDDMTRSIVALRYYDGLSSRQIGEIFGLAATAVDMRLSRARRQLRDLLTEQAPPTSEVSLGQ